MIAALLHHLRAARARRQHERRQRRCKHEWRDHLVLDPKHPHAPDAQRTTCRLCGALSCWRCRGDGGTWFDGALILAWGGRCEDCDPPGSGRAGAEQVRRDRIMGRIPT